MNPAGGRPPSTALPLLYLATGALAFVAAAVAVPWMADALAGHYYDPRLFAVTHLVTLGWITLSIMGATYQLVPAILGRPLASDRLAAWAFGGAVLGLVGMVGHFLIVEWSGLAWSAGLVVAALVLHVVNVARTLRGLADWTFTARLIAWAPAGLGLTAVMGLGLAVNHLRPVLPLGPFPVVHAHVHAALLGWVVPMVLGVAARAYPMFLLAPEPSRRATAVQGVGLALGAPAVVAGLLGLPLALGLGALAIVAAVAAHLTSVAGMVRARRRPALDGGLRCVLAGAAFLVPATAMGVALATGALGGPRAALAYAVCVFGGWLTLTIAGMMLKIVPFVVWYRVYAPRAGREAVPMLADLTWPAAERLACVLLAAGALGLAGAVGVGHVTAIRIAGLVLAAGALAFAAVLVRILRHVRLAWRPRFSVPLAVA